MEELRKLSLDNEPVTLSLTVHNEHHWPSRQTY